MKSLKNGDVNSFERLYKLYYSKLHSFCKKYDQASIEPDDFVQQTFLKLWDNKHLLKEDVLFDKQIFVICKNIILNQLKRDKKIQAGLDPGMVASEYSEEPQQEEGDRNIRNLAATIEKLPPKRKEIFILHKLNNFTYKEIAGSLGISQKTIANHIYLATQFIRKELKKIEIKV